MLSHLRTAMNLLPSSCWIKTNCDNRHSLSGLSAGVAQSVYWLAKDCTASISKSYRSGGAVGWDTALLAGRSRVRFLKVSLEIFIDIALPATLWPWGLNQPLTEMRNISGRGVKVAGVQGCQPYHLLVQIVLKSGNLNLLELSGSV